MLVALLLGGTLVGAPPASAEPLPSKDAWKAESEQIMRGSVAYVERRASARHPHERLALNLDIDNTALATHYEPGVAVAPVLRLARRAQQLGVAVQFNTARPRADLASAKRMLERAGFPVDRICGKPKGVKMVAGKKRCRAASVRAGYTIIANVGNSATDFKGGNYERRYKLRSYGGKLK